MILQIVVLDLKTININNCITLYNTITSDNSANNSTSNSTILVCLEVTQYG